MNTQQIINLIDRSLFEIDKIVAKSINDQPDKEPISSTKKVLTLLKKDIQSQPDNINRRLLRAMHDLGMSAYKDFENTSVENALNELVQLLYNDVPIYKNLEPLRNDFGKGDPV